MPPVCDILAGLGKFKRYAHAAGAFYQNRIFAGMSFKILGIICPKLFVLLCGSIVFVQNPNQAEHAHEILRQSREALGSDAVLKSVQSLSALGDFRSGSAGTQASGDFQLDILLPDKVIRTMRWNPTKELKIAVVEARDGRQVWKDFKEKDSNRMPVFGPMGRGSVGSKGSSGNRGEQAPNIIDYPENQQIWSDFSCLVIGMLLHLPDSAKVEYISDIDQEPGITADFLKIDSDGTIFRLVIDQKTHLPVMAAYEFLPQTESRDAGKEAGISKTEKMQIQIYFSGYKSVTGKKFGGLLLPHQITKTRNGVTVEDMHITKFQLNSHPKPKQFDQKRHDVQRKNS
jgi:hypothetical protein